MKLVKFSSLLLVLLTANQASAAPSTPRPAIGSVVEVFTFKDIRYLARSLDDFGKKKAIVLVFTTLECPLVARYLPRVAQLEEKYRAQDVQFVAVNVGPDDALVEVAHQALAAECPFPFVKDFSGEAVRALGVLRTPEAVVLDAARRLRYRGRIDSQFRLGGVRPDPAREDLKIALDEVLAGSEVSVPQTPVDGCAISLPADRAADGAVTFAEHVAPLLAAHCQECHRAQGDAPFALASYDDALSHAEMIAEVVAERRMPPWYAASAHGKFANRRGLSAQEQRTIVDWVRGGRVQGDLAKLPPPREYPQGRWRIGTPDLVIKSLQAVNIPATGYMPYQYTVLPFVFTSDTWVQGVQILPGNPAALHHCNMAYLKLGQGFHSGNFITGQVPGGDAMRLADGVAFCIPAGSVLGLQMHYVPTGTATKDQVSVGLVFAKETVNKRLRHVTAKNLSLKIPPGAPHHRVAAAVTIPCNATGVGMFSHMHLRGKDMTFRALAPDGGRETLLSIANYSFDWQMPYRWAPGQQRFARGTRLECVAHYDNSTFNPYNPDPSATVHEGQQTFQEMMYGFLFYTDDEEQLGIAVDPKSGREISRDATR